MWLLHDHIWYVILRYQYCSYMYPIAYFDCLHYFFCAVCCILQLYITGAQMYVPTVWCGAGLINTCPTDHQKVVLSNDF